MEKKLQDAELKVMNVIWREGKTTAKHIADVLKEETGWNVNTTYTLLKRCIEKGAVERTEPHFTCRALIAKEEVQREETDRLIDKVFDGSAAGLFAALLGRKKLTENEIAQLRALIDELE
ncbi:MAG: BlaI/MecI/CopY family transcriptional regulator [Oscillospiraceae bacterium]|nr:BlaI/MecI/CopY family transcriptional regulator [Oscillospiraceae bacterium]